MFCKGCNTIIEAKNDVPEQNLNTLDIKWLKKKIDQTAPISSKWDNKIRCKNPVKLSADLPPCTAQFERPKKENRYEKISFLATYYREIYWKN